MAKNLEIDPTDEVFRKELAEFTCYCTRIFILRSQINRVLEAHEIPQVILDIAQIKSIATKLANFKFSEPQKEESDDDE